MPRCEDSTFVTAGDWVHAIGGLPEILGIAGAALVLTASQAISYPWAAPPSEPSRSCS